MMKVELVDYQANARDLLLFAKGTRLGREMDASLLDEIKNWSEEKKVQELHHVLTTIPSGWEFVSYTFSINGVSRGFTHQFVRHRQASYAQQSQRYVNMAEFSFVVPENIKANPEQENAFELAMLKASEAYELLGALGAEPQDARGVLPTNVETGIVARYNLRSLSDAMELRLCVRTQGETQAVFRAMRDRILEVHPWAEPILRVACAKNGVCAFPRLPLSECSIKPEVFDPDHEGNSTTYGGRLYPANKTRIQALWELMGVSQAKVK